MREAERERERMFFHRLCVGVCVCLTEKIVGACVNERERKRKNHVMIWRCVCVCVFERARETLCAGCTCESVCGLLDVLKKCECVYRRE